MEKNTLISLVSELIAHWENEVVEFKNVGDSYSTSDIGKYFSALANEANLRGHEKAWLVFGVDNNSRAIAGSDYRQNRQRLQSLKMQIASDTEPSITFRDIHELTIDGKRVLLFEVPAAPMGMPIAWKGHYYARAGESLTNLGLDKQDEIRNQTGATDWSGNVISAATLDHFEPQALAKARQLFTKKYANRFAADEVLGWPDRVFLDRARLTKDGQITRAAILLLGKKESSHLLMPHPAQMAWKLEGAERAYLLFWPSFSLDHH